MPYSSSLSDQEWEILEPLLLEFLPPKKRTRPPEWTKREILDGILYQLKNLEFRLTRSAQLRGESASREKGSGR